MEPEPHRYVRGEEIRDRLGAIHDRLAALARARAADRDSIPPDDPAARAQAALDAAAYAAVSRTRALYWVAQAHQHAAQVHDKAAATGAGIRPSTTGRRLSTATRPKPTALGQPGYPPPGPWPGDE
jgi:hypothetical protein